jgi:hypothetical protein
MQQNEMASILSRPLLLLYMALCTTVYITVVSPAIYKGHILVTVSVMMSSSTKNAEMHVGGLHVKCPLLSADLN